MEEKKLVPKLRFPGFTEPWEQRKLGDYLVVSYLKNFEGKYDKEDVLSVSGDYGIVNQIDFQGRSFAGKSVLNYGIVGMGDIVYTKSPLKKNPFGIIKTNKLNSGIVSTLYAIYTPKKNCNAIFVEHYFELDSRLNEYLKPLVNKGAKNDMKVSSEKALDGNIIFPAIEEQKRISAFLEFFGRYITLHQRKLEHLKLKKKSLLQKLFPKEGEVYPELRFPGFTDPWEQRKLGDLYKSRREKNDGRFGTDKIISVANMYFKDNVKLTKCEYLQTYNVFLLGDIAFEGNRNNLFSHGRFVENSIGNGIVSHVFDVLMPKTKYCINYWKIFINYEPIMGKILRRCTNSSQMMANLELKAFLKETIHVPTIKEQQKIGNFLEQFDQYITLHQRKLEHLQLLKKALLQQLFV